jgi:hypothetical protein
MAEAMIQRVWPDGETLTISIETDASFPDALDEARMECRRLYAEALEITLTPVEGDEA